MITDLGDFCLKKCKRNNCCTASNFKSVSIKEAREIARKKKIEPHEFLDITTNEWHADLDPSGLIDDDIRPWIESTGRSMTITLKSKDGWCIFYDESKKSCRIWSFKPTVCCTYPLSVNIRSGKVTPIKRCSAWKLALKWKDKDKNEDNLRETVLKNALELAMTMNRVTGVFVKEIRAEYGKEDTDKLLEKYIDKVVKG